MEPLSPNASRFTIGDANFVIDISATYHRRPSDSDAFTLVKTPEYLNLYMELARSFKPRTILELGVFQGGGYVFLDQVFQPDSMSAVELSPKPVEPLVDYCTARSSRVVHWGKSQTDAATLKGAVGMDLGGRLDLVVDDASHSYPETRESFTILYPLLAPGGYYIIEDWPWSHGPLYQAEGAPRADKTALTTLLFDLIMLHGSANLIAELRVYRPFLMVRKALSATAVPSDFWQLIRDRGRPHPQI